MAEDVKEWQPVNLEGHTYYTNESLMPLTEAPHLPTTEDMKTSIHVPALTILVQHCSTMNQTQGPSQYGSVSNISTRYLRHAQHIAYSEQGRHHLNSWHAMHQVQQLQSSALLL